VGFGFFKQASKFFHILYFQWSDVSSVILLQIQIELWYTSLTINTAKQESGDLAISAAIGLREGILSELSVTCCKYHPEKRGL